MTEYYIPGRSGPQRFRPVEPPEDELDALLGDGKRLRYGDRAVTFYKIGSLARALGRSVVTIRKWQSKGYIPRPAFSLPTEALGGKLRLYTREQIEGLRRIAAEEGILYDLTKSIRHTNFPDRAFALFEELSEE